MNTRPVVKPSQNPARVVGGRIVRPVNGIDWLLFGVVAITPLNAGSRAVLPSLKSRSGGAMPLTAQAQRPLRSPAQPQ